MENKVTTKAEVVEEMEELWVKLYALVAKGTPDDLINKNFQLEAELKQLRGENESIRKRISGMSSMLSRIRVKCDIATGLEHNVDYDDQGRSIGAEGAVDRLLAFSLGKVFVKSKGAKFIELDLHDQINALEEELRGYREHGTETE